MDATKAMLRDHWAERLATQTHSAAQVAKEIAAIDALSRKATVQSLLTEDKALEDAYKQQIVELAARKLMLTERLTSAGKPKTDFEDISRTALEFLASHWKLRSSGSFYHKSVVLKWRLPDR